MSRRSNYTAKFKTKIVLEVLKEEKELGVIAYENNKNSLETTITEMVTKILGLNNIHVEDAISASDIPVSDFDFNEVISDLDGFKNE